MSNMLSVITGNASTYNGGNERDHDCLQVILTSADDESHEVLLRCKISGDFPVMKQQIHQALARIDVYIPGKAVLFPGSYTLSNHKFLLDDFVQECLLSKLGTYEKSSEDFVAGIENLCSNQALIDASMPHGFFENALKGKMVFIVGSGPTSDYWIPFIREMQDQAVICCFDSSTRQLVESGVVPDYIFSIERCGIPESFFLHEQLGKDTVLIGPYTVNRVFPTKGIRHVFCGNRNDSFLSSVDRMRNLMPIDIGLTVANLAIGFCLRGGAKAVALFGIDLAYLDGQTHAGSLTKTLDNETQAYYRNQVTMVTGIAGKPLTTLPFFRYTRDHLEKQIGESPQTTVFNMSQYGARIDGTVDFCEYDLRQFMKSAITRNHTKVDFLQTNEKESSVRRFLIKYKAQLERLLELGSYEEKIRMIYCEDALFGTFVRLLNQIYRNEESGENIDRLATEIINRLETLYV